MPEVMVGAGKGDESSPMTRRRLAPTDEPSRLSKVIDFGRWLIGQLKTLSDEEYVPWYRAADQDEISRYLVDEIRLTRNAYISPVNYKDLAKLASLKGNLIACETICAYFSARQPIIN